MRYEKYEDNSGWKVGALYWSPQDVWVESRKYTCKWMRFFQRPERSHHWAKTGWWQPQGTSCNLVYLGCYRVLSEPFLNDIVYRFLAMDGTGTVVYALEPEALKEELELAVEPT